MTAERCPDEFIALAGQLADASGAIIRQYFRTPIPVDTKADDSPVTIADREAETVMRTIIEDAYPDHGIFGEEHGFVRTEAEFAWVLDPIDGTKAFISGMPIFGILIALMRDGKPILGIIDQPISGERWVGAAGTPTTLNGAPIATRKDSTLATATNYTTHPDMFKTDDERTRVAAMAAQVAVSRYGGDCYAYGLLATGFVDLVTEASLKIYDFMALVPVVEGAGGIMTDWSGAPLDRHSDGHVLAAANETCHREAMAYLKGA